MAASLPSSSTPTPSSSTGVPMDVIMASLPNDDARAVYRYWYRSNPTVTGYEHDTALWFRGGPLIDKEIKQQFESVWKHLSTATDEQLSQWTVTPRGTLCAILVLDQMARNMFRGTAGMFATDHIATRLALAAVEPSPPSTSSSTSSPTPTSVPAGIAGLAAAEELFIWIALEHSENITTVESAVAGQSSLLARVSCTDGNGDRTQMGAITRMHRVATQHYEVLKLWGRYPHRNHVLGRVSTDDEKQFLETALGKYPFMRSINRPIIQRTRRQKAATTTSNDNDEKETKDASGGATNSTSGGKKRKLLKVLVLHSFRQNARILQAKTARLRSVLRDTAELVYAESPLSYQPMGEILDASIQVFGKVPDTPKQKCWWHASHDNSEYYGLDITLKYIDHMFKTQGPFDGVLGFSQGGALAGILAALQPFGAVHFKFVLCLSGFASRAAAHVPLMQPGRLTMPSYHVIGAKDILVDPDRSRKLYQCFKDGVLYEHGGGHFVPNLWPNEAFKTFMTPFLSNDTVVDSTPAIPSGIAAAIGVSSPAVPPPSVDATSTTAPTVTSSSSSSAASVVAASTPSLPITFAEATAFVAAEAKTLIGGKDDVSSPSSSSATPAEIKAAKRARKAAAVAAASPAVTAAEPTLLAHILPIVATQPERISQVVIKELRDHAAAGWKDLATLAVAIADAHSKLVAQADAEKKATAAATIATPSPATPSDASSQRHSRMAWLETLRQEIVMTFAAQLHEDRALLIAAGRWNESQTATVRRQADRDERKKLLHAAVAVARTPGSGTTWSPSPAATVTAASTTTETASSSTASGEAKSLVQHKLGSAIPDVVDLEDGKLYVTMDEGKHRVVGMPHLPSDCAWHAPRIGQAVDNKSRLAKDTARSLFPLHAPTAESLKRAAANNNDPLKHTKGVCYETYRRLLVTLCSVLEVGTPNYAARQQQRLREARVYTVDKWNQLMEVPLSSEVLNPEPEPVQPCGLDELEPLLVHLREQKPVPEQTAFMRGTLVPDGRLDLCKMVVGPKGIDPLLRAMDDNKCVKRLLLGNNIVGDGGALSIAKHIVKPTSHLDTWYIAGNEFTELGIAAVADALANDTKVKALWLKRNPLKVAGCIPLARMLEKNHLIEVLDLVNCGILDDGVAIIFDALKVNRTLRHLYIGTNGLTEVAGERIGAHFAEGKNELHSLFVSCNRMGDNGMVHMARGLAIDRTLQRLSVASNRITSVGCRALTDALARHPALVYFDIGFTRATTAVGELGNRIEDLGAAYVADLLKHNTVIRSIDLLHNSIGQVGLNHLRDAMRVNHSLTTLNFTQFGKVHNEVGKEELRAAIDRNRLSMVPSLLRKLAKVDTPDHIAEIYSVYRTH